MPKTLTILLMLTLAACSGKDSFPNDARTKAAEEQVRAKWGKSLAELPTRKLVIISPHSENIRNEFEWAFSLDHAVRYGIKITFEWRSVGGGSNSINQFLTNTYKYKDTSEIDILWGGGDYNFIPLAKLGILEPLNLPAEIRDNIPEKIGSVRMYDPNLYWVGAAISAFGYIYNAEMLKRCSIALPDGTWDDLADKRFTDLLSLADPSQSGSAASAYTIVAQSGEDWPQGWGKLLGILANAKRFTDSAGSAANAPVLGEALVAACIDFYGAVRVTEAPGQVVYVSPQGQTAFNPDPIAILKNPPNPELAQHFVEFVLGTRGQSLWALPVGTADGPARSVLGRQPVRKDVYDLYAGKMIASIVKPYEAGQAMMLEGWRTKVDYRVLTQLVKTAAVDNSDGLRAARAALHRAGSPAEMLAEFHRLPPNIDSVDKMAAITAALKDPTAAERLLTDWQRFFREKYERIVGWKAGEAGAGSMTMPHGGNCGLRISDCGLGSGAKACRCLMSAVAMLFNPATCLPAGRSAIRNPQFRLPEVLQ